MDSTGSRFVTVFRFMLRSSKRVAVSVVGGLLVLGGLAMLVLPGPGILVVVAGFAVLGTEYAWAAHALDKTKTVVESAGRKAKDSAGRAGRTARDTAGRAGRTARGVAGSATGRFRHGTDRGPADG